MALLAWALAAGGRPAEPAPVADAASAPAPDAPRVPAPEVGAGLDPVAFARHVQPVLAARCASCHSVVGGGGGLLLAQGSDPRTVEANLWAARRFVAPGRPQESALLLKPLPAHEGGPGHGGGEVLTMASPEWAALAAWVGAAWVGGEAPGPTVAPAGPGGPSAGPGDAPLEVTIEAARAEVTVGEPVALRAAAVGRGQPLAYRWALRARPTGSEARVERPAEAEAQLVADRPGTYVVMLVVHDSAASGTAELTLVAAERASAPAAAPPPSAAGPRAFQALVGRAPTADEARALSGLGGEALIKALLARPEPHQAWWEAELEHLGLTGPHRPKGATWDSVSERLRAGRITPVDALQALLFSQAWTARHAGKEAYVAAVLERVLGLEARDAAAARGPAERLHDGHEAELFGRKGESQADLVRIAGQDPRARRALLARAHRRVTGRAATPEALEAAVARTGEAPGELMATIVGWACQQ
ncbi:MAG: PKD domain-containing protein [Planctomycetes bacterium]|nr:PKD domain-containing protein [Planctomycetota bacterium]